MTSIAARPAETFTAEGSPKGAEIRVEQREGIRKGDILVSFACEPLDRIVGGCTAAITGVFDRCLRRPGNDASQAHDCDRHVVSSTWEPWSPGALKQQRQQEQQQHQ